MVLVNTPNFYNIRVTLPKRYGYYY